MSRPCDRKTGNYKRGRADPKFVSCKVSKYYTMNMVNLPPDCTLKLQNRIKNLSFLKSPTPGVQHRDRAGPKLIDDKVPNIGH